MSNRYNGWQNRETWNLALWIQNDEDFYKFALHCTKVTEFIGTKPFTYFKDNVAMAGFEDKTGDGVLWHDTKINEDEINKMMEEL